jgi:lysyl-tRNA synthetase class 2
MNNNLQQKYLAAIKLDSQLENNILHKNNINIDKLIDNFENLNNTQVHTYGRIIQHRNSKMFLIIRNNGCDIQCYLSKEEKYNYIKTILTTGDVIKLSGKYKLSTTEEKTIFIDAISIIAKCLQSIPDQYYMQNKQKKYQIENRTLCLTFQKKTFNLISIRFNVIKKIREFLYKCDFLEGDTPTLCKIAGGASATPFTTKYLVQKQDYSLRIAPELYLKRLIISGFPKIFEICHNFRNEGVSVLHNPEFTMLEAYEIGIKLPDVIENVFNLIEHITKFLNEKYKYNLTVNFSRNSIKFYDIINKLIPNANELTLLQLIDLAESKFNIHYENKEEIKIIEEVYDDIISKFYIPKYHPDIIVLTHHPKAISPLSKCIDDVALRFEIYYKGIEIADGYEENNNSEIQTSTFEQQEKIYNRKSDYTFCKDLSLGMMQTCGYGIGIDRLLKILLELSNIREAIPFTE